MKYVHLSLYYVYLEEGMEVTVSFRLSVKLCCKVGLPSGYSWESVVSLDATILKLKMSNLKFWID